MAWAPDYVDVDVLANYMRIGDDADDVELAIAASAASRAIDDHCNRQFGLADVAEERRYSAWFDSTWSRWVVPVDDLMTVDGLAVEVSNSGVLTGFVKEPRNAASKGRPWTRLTVDGASSVQPTGDEYEVAVTARWGWSAVPIQVKQATLLQASRFHSRRDSPYGIAGSPTEGSEMRLLSKLDPDVAVSLRALMRPRRLA